MWRLSTKGRTFILEATGNRSRINIDNMASTFWKATQKSIPGGANPGMTDRKVIGLYHIPDECKQFNSEVKTNMDLERWPSGKLDTSELVVKLAIPAYNILQMNGQESIGRKGTETKHRVRCRKLYTVIGRQYDSDGKPRYRVPPVVTHRPWSE